MLELRVADTPHTKNADIAPVTVAATTQFFDDAKSNKTEFPSKDLGARATGLRPVEDQGLKAFLEKPLLIDDISWSSVSAANTEIGTYDITALLSSTIYADKLKGYRWFRGTACFRLVVNAQPFQQGRLLMHYLPFVSQQTTGWINAKQLNLTTKTQHPNVEVDCRNATGELCIPYTHPAGWFDVSGKNDTSIGKVYLTVLSQLASSGATTADASIYLYWKDVQFSGPTVPQSGLSVKKRGNRKVQPQEIPEDTPVTNALLLTSKVANWFSGIPLISSYAGPISNVALSLSNVAAKYGWAKPPLDVNGGYVLPRPFHTLGNDSGSNYGENLSLTTAPWVKPMSGFAGSDVDEMAFDYIKAIPAYITVFSMSTAGLANDILYTATLTPGGMQTTNVVSGAFTYTLEYGAPYAHLARCFQYATGSLRLHLKVVKTDFHSGRIQVTWTPGRFAYSGTAVSNPDIYTSAFSMREVIDIRECSDMEIILPYSMPTPFIGVYDQLGDVQVRIVNPLKASGSVAASIDFLVYYSAGPDFQLTTPASDSLVIIQPQSGLPDTAELTMPGYSGLTGSTTEYVTGEQFSSVKQLLTRANRMYFGTNGEPNTTTYYRFNPFVMGSMSYQPAGSDVGRIAPDMYSYIGTAFALSRGGMSFCFHSGNDVAVVVDWSNGYNNQLRRTGVATVPFAASVSAAAGGGDTGYPTSNTSLFNYPTAPTTTYIGNSVALYSTANQGCVFNVPHSSCTPSRFNFVTSMDGDTFNPSNRLGFNPSFVTWACYPTRANGMKVFRMVADDFQLGLFVGFHPICTFRA